MLHDQDLPLHLQDEACNTTVYLHNISPHRILRMIRLEEVFLGKKTGVGHFIMFGSSIYSHATNDGWKTLDPTSHLGIFFGYNDTPHNYLVYMALRMMIVVCRDLKFDEERAMIFSLEREIQLHAYEELLAPKKEPQDDVKQLHAKE